MAGIRKAAVIGAGTMGSGIASHLANAGVPVVLLDIVPEGAGEHIVDDTPGTMFVEPRGALLAVGKHKGYGLALMCELLGGVLTGGGTMQPENPRTGGIVNNMLTVIIDPGRLVDRAWLDAELDAVVEFVKASRPDKSGGSVLVAGDPERLMRTQRQRDGIPMNDVTWEEIIQAAQQVGMPREQVESMLA